MIDIIITQEMNKRKSSANRLSFSKPIWDSGTEEKVSSVQKPLIVDYKKELTFYFYNAMLENITQKWEVIVNDTTESIPSGDEIICSKPYEPYDEIKVVEEETNSETLPISQSTFGKTLIGSIRTSKIKNLEASTMDLRKTRKGLNRKTITKLKKSKSKFLLKSFSQNLFDENKLDKDNWIILKEIENAEIKFDNGNQYIGELYQKIMHGTGQFIWADGTIYTGDFKNGEMTGKGRIEYTDKSVYEGEIYKGYIHGYGNEYRSYKDSFYNGEYYLSSKHGKGRMIFGKNNYYDGPWKMNERNGRGFRYYNTGYKYYGDYLNGKRNGFGSAVLKNIDFYQGDWINGEKCGYGEYVWNAFFNNVLSIPVQNKYCGIWDNDFMHGFGLLYFGTEGGARYAGTFFRNIKHGTGIVVCNNGNVIKADPLFINDKSVCQFKKIKECRSSVTSSSSHINSENLEANNFINNCTSLTCGNLEPRIYPILPQHKLKQPDLSNIRNFVFPCYGFERSTVAYINQCNLIHGNNFNIECVSMSIDLSSSELIDLKKIINEVAFKYLYDIKNTNNKENTNNIKARYFKEFNAWPCLFPEHFCEDYVFERFNKYKKCENFFVFEDERTRKAIKVNLPYLLDLYNYYAFVACIHEKPTYKPWMMRIYFWQLFIDCKIPHKNICLNEIDEMLAEYSPITVADIHNPFDIIYFWQFLMSFIILSWKLYGNDFINIKTNGILENAFNKFLVNDVFPNAKNHKGCALFEYKDVIPITAAFEWYKSFGPNFTVYDFLKYSSTLHRSLPPGYYQEIGVKIPKIKNGQNIAFISDKIIYREVQSYVVENKKYNYPVVYAHTHAYYLKSLKYLFLLGGRRVLTILKEVCPVIAVQNEFINMNHVLSFMEFYEAVLKCTQEKVIQDAKIMTINSMDIETRRTLINFSLPTYSKFKSISSKKKLNRAKSKQK